VTEIIIAEQLGREYVAPTMTRAFVVVENDPHDERPM
jgi:hypothetical protein